MTAPLPPSISKKMLDPLVGKKITVFLTNKTALKGKLESFDRRELLLIGDDGVETVVTRSHVTTIKGA